MQRLILGGLFMAFISRKKSGVTSGARGIRNNNPLNIRKSDDKWLGRDGDDGVFMKFESPEYGIRAATKIMVNYGRLYGINTLSGIVARWAPAHENDTQNYINFVSSETGLEPTDLVTHGDLPAMIKAMIHMENGSQPYSDEIIKRGVYMGIA